MLKKCIFLERRAVIILHGVLDFLISHIIASVNVISCASAKEEGFLSLSINSGHIVEEDMIFCCSMFENVCNCGFLLVLLCYQSQ